MNLTDLANIGQVIGAIVGQPRWLPATSAAGGAPALQIALTREREPDRIEMSEGNFQFCELFGGTMNFEAKEICHG